MLFDDAIVAMIQNLQLIIMLYVTCYILHSGPVEEFKIKNSIAVVSSSYSITGTVNKLKVNNSPHHQILK